MLVEKKDKKLAKKTKEAVNMINGTGSSMEIYYSNRIEVLFEQFKASLFAESDPFARRWVVVPSPPLKSWLMLQLAQDPSLKIATGIEIGYPNEIFQKLNALVSDRPLTASLPAPLELALAIEWEIKQALQSPNDQWAPVGRYLEVPRGSTLSKKGEKRLTALSEKLAHLFLQYGLYGAGMLSTWEAHPESHWQASLWHSLFCSPQSPWTHPYREWTRPFQKKEISSTSVYLFSNSFIPPVQFRFLSKIASCLPVYSYHLSPCEVFWGDLLSIKESRRLQEFWRKKGASVVQQKELELYLKDCNPLLANFGRLGREMAQQIEESSAQTHELYIHPGTETVLKSVQEDLLSLRNPALHPCTEFSGDTSIQIHGAPSRLREIQVLRETVLGILHKHQSDPVPLKPHEILVMAPDIMQYEPFIKLFFAPEQGLDVQIMDVRSSSQNTLVQGFLKLLEIPFGRWDAASITALFENPSFAKKQQLKSQELTLFKQWVKECGIRWGENLNHREELLKRDQCSRGLVDPSNAGTWELGWNRLLGGLILEEESLLVEHPITPYPHLENTQAELIGHLIHLFNQLRKDLTCLSNGTERSLDEWYETLQMLLKTYFDLEPQGPEAELLLKQLEQFRKSAKHLNQARFSFLSIKRHLSSALEKTHATYRESQLHAIKFCSLLPMRTLPARVIVLLGMQEGDFPRPDSLSSLNLMRGHSQVDYNPSQVDFDRYIFIEALLSARDYFILSYRTRSEDEFKETSPSLLITELLNYLDRGYTLDAQAPSKKCFTQHPLNAFDARYFSPTATFKSTSQSDYKAALAHYDNLKVPVHRFIPQFTNTPLSDSVKGDLYIDLKDLAAFAKDPLKSYFNKTLGMYLRNEEVVSAEDPFLLNPLAYYQLRKVGLKQTPDSALKQLEKEGKLPPGLFKYPTEQKLREDLAKIDENLKKLGVDLATAHTLEFSERFTTPIQTDVGWKFPPLILKSTSQRVFLSGTISGVTPQGLVLIEGKKIKTAAQAWPIYLAFALLNQKYQLPYTSRLLFAGDGSILSLDKEDPSHYLNTYVDYYLEGIKSGSPLLAEWLEHFLKDATHKLVIPNYNPYVQWQTRGMEMPSYENWSEKAQQIYGNLYTRVNAKGKKEDLDA